MAYVRENYDKECPKTLLAKMGNVADEAFHRLVEGAELSFEFLREELYERDPNPYVWLPKWCTTNFHE